MIVGRMTAEQFEFHRINGLDMTQQALANHLGTSITTINRHRDTPENKSARTTKCLGLHLARAVEVKFLRRLVEAYKADDEKEVRLANRAWIRFENGLNDLKSSQSTKVSKTL